MIWDTIREALPIVGKRVIDVTCTERGEVPSLVYIHFSDFSTLTINADEERGFLYDGHEEKRT